MDVLLWKGDPGQREAACLQELLDMARVEVWGIEEASAGSFNTAGLYGTSKTEESAAACISPGKALLQPCCSIFHFLSDIKMLQFFLGTAFVYCY